jgi:hypothetical protein
MCFVRLSEQTATFALYNIKRLVFITEVESVYSAVHAESLYKIDTLLNPFSNWRGSEKSSQRLKIQEPEIRHLQQPLNGNNVRNSSHCQKFSLT